MTTQDPFRFVYGGAGRITGYATQSNVSVTVAVTEEHEIIATADVAVPLCSAEAERQGGYMGNVDQVDAYTTVSQLARNLEYATALVKLEREAGCKLPVVVYTRIARG